MPASITEILRDPLWQFVGVVLALAAIAASYLQFRATIARKELTFGVLASRKLVAIADEVTSRVSIQLDGRSVSNVYMVEFGIKNSGNQPILRDNFDEPFRINFLKGTSVISAEVTRIHPETLAASVSIQPGSIVVDPLLLNPGDYLVIQALTSGNRPEHTAKGRIVGVSSVAPINTGWRVDPLPFFPFSHPMNGASMLVWMFVVAAVGAYVLGARQFAQVSLIGAVVSGCLSLGHWFMGKRGLNAGRYIDEA